MTRRGAADACRRRGAAAETPFFPAASCEKRRSAAASHFCDLDPVELPAGLRRWHKLEPRQIQLLQRVVHDGSFCDLRSGPSHRIPDHRLACPSAQARSFVEIPRKYRVNANGPPAGGFSIMKSYACRRLREDQGRKALSPGANSFQFGNEIPAWAAGQLIFGRLTV